MAASQWSTRCGDKRGAELSPTCPPQASPHLSLLMQKKFRHNYVFACDTVTGPRVSPKETRWFPRVVSSVAYLSGPHCPPSLPNALRGDGTRFCGCYRIPGRGGEWGGAERGCPPGKMERLQCPCSPPPRLCPQRLALEGTKQSQMVASALENSAKNRYRNVLPCES